MPGVPKPANKRVRRNAGGVEFREVQITAGEQPSLPERDRPWSQETLEFWESLGESELAADFTNAEWRVLMMAALVHEEVWSDGRMTRIDQFDWKSPILMNGSSLMVKASSPPQVHWLKIVHERTADSTSRPVVIDWDATLPMRRPKRPATIAPTSGAKTTVVIRDCGVMFRSVSPSSSRRRRRRCRRDYGRR